MACPAPSAAISPGAAPLLAAVLACCVALPSLRADKYVVVRSNVAPIYAARRAAAPAGKAETYVVMRGQYLNPIPMDSYLERMDFRTIAATLAGDMKPHGYVPARDLITADLVLVIHWGVTLANESQAEEFLYDYDVMRVAGTAMAEARERADDPAKRSGDGRGVLEAVEETQLAYQAEAAVSGSVARRSAIQTHTNAELLGLQSTLAEEDKAPFGSALADTLRLMLNEERYFIIVVAYDAAAMREGRKQRLWTTRASIRAAGVNFAMALDRISSTAAGFHGVPQASLAFEKSTDRAAVPKIGQVLIGDLKVIGDDQPPIPTKRGR